jgi:hypothetical protein
VTEEKVYVRQKRAEEDPYANACTGVICPKGMWCEKGACVGEQVAAQEMPPAVVVPASIVKAPEQEAAQETPVAHSQPTNMTVVSAGTADKIVNGGGMPWGLIGLGVGLFFLTR